jgi:hypothetical protein
MLEIGPEGPDRLPADHPLAGHLDVYQWLTVLQEFLVLGLMGKPMAGHLVAKGFAVIVHSRSPGPVDALVALGAERASSPADVASRATRIITMLPDSPDVEPDEQALRIAEWINAGRENPGDAANATFPGPHWLRQPPSYSDREWILAIADQYRTLENKVSVASS